MRAPLKFGKLPSKTVRTLIKTFFHQNCLVNLSGLVLVTTITLVILCVESAGIRSISGPDFAVFSLNAAKCGAGKLQMLALFR